MTLAQQYDIFLNQLTTRRRNPAKPATIAAYRSYWLNWVNPQLGKLDLSKVENGAMKKLVAHLAASGLAPASIQSISQLVKGIVASAVDDNGNVLYPRKWNSDFIDSPIIQNQKSPIISAEQVTEAIVKGGSQYGPFFALLAGSGLRVSEALALKRDPQLSSSYWDVQNSKLSVLKALYKGREQATKTAAGVREVDLAPELNDYLVSNLTQKEEFLFPFHIRTLYDVAEKAGVPGYHAFRRYRLTHLENEGVPRGLCLYWSGHSGKDVHDRYVRLDKDIEERKRWAKQAGLGFSLPKQEILATESDLQVESKNKQLSQPHKLLTKN